VRFDAVITLIEITYAKDAIGQEIAIPNARQVYANEFMVSAEEFYDAGRNGLKAERQYQVRSCDYAGETELSVDGVWYDIIRPQRRGEWTLLTCQSKVGIASDAGEVS
jgi:SPP1 family predicted phage head-tail adaptor